MGTEQSSHANGPSKEEQEVTSSMKVIGERGRSIEQKKTNEFYNRSLEKDSLVGVNQFDQAIVLSLTLDMTDTESEYSSSDESDDDEEDLERVLVLEEAEKLKTLAKAFLHPEAFVTVNGTATARCYFDRNSANAQENVESTDDRNAIMEDMKNLRAAASFYLHPEHGVITTDSTTCGRNYFSRPSSVAQENVDDAGERAQILADAVALKKLAVDYAHLEFGVITTDPATCGRNYFSRPSSVAQEDVDDVEERAQILADAVALKKLAVDYTHPELGVVTTDPTTLMRNYFSRLSAVEEECKADAEERAQILADAATLKRLAVDYAHPEYSVSTTDATAFGRNYFTMRSIGEPLEALNANTSRTQKKDLMKSKIEDKQPVTSKLFGAKDGLHNKLSKIVTGHVKRSPSTVILFGLGDDDGSAY